MQSLKIITKGKSKKKTKNKKTTHGLVKMSKYSGPTPKTGLACLSSLKLCTAVGVGRVAQEKYEEHFVDNDKFRVCTTSWNSVNNSKLTQELLNLFNLSTALKPICFCFKVKSFL